MCSCGQCGKSLRGPNGLQRAHKCTFGDHQVFSPAICFAVEDSVNPYNGICHRCHGYYLYIRLLLMYSPVVTQARE